MPSVSTVFTGFSISGDRALVKALGALPERIERKVSRKGLIAAWAPIRKELRNNLPRRTGRLRRHIARKFRDFKKEGAVLLDGGFKRGVGRVAHLIEFGTAERFHESGKSTGAGPALHPFRDAWMSKQGEALEAMKAKIRIEIPVEVRKIRGF